MCFLIRPREYKRQVMSAITLSEVALVITCADLTVWYGRHVTPLWRIQCESVEGLFGGRAVRTLLSGKFPTSGSIGQHNTPKGVN
jgi:hypothetical protein